MADKPNAEIVDALYAVIESRRGTDPGSSYTAQLLAKGTGKIAEKVGEEAVETVVAALNEGPDALAAESADLIYHLCVLWADAGVRPEDVWTILAERQGMSGLTEKANRKS
ncbi:MAG: phosphoribosyl-ATP diphosphatase [Rhodospirillaceae bacterium]|jgi:phosphoribosyl-ATP pyrophosphohydrolase|nr:phosphoribosyl-ATP diphosphatase [Rhodospirillaceae bacterium]MBT5943922.1 phosphoribosyl-ATP diphosphatase [Rhodospirillaceae bacterium]MBT6402955.1 phosphoribosyl-ATP diphosphatase [Rhodospirillaceae bacterium]MBT6537032.1 phosphoribosyl-ATP diphosphatase [Rhodospirillaceae bacterium]MBT7362336.1 phosphoribosyl-ATP diphosphatase [Rhodospirillaceae bacterium]